MSRLSSFTANRVFVLFFGLWMSFTFGLLAISCAGEEEQQQQPSVQLSEGRQALGRGEIGQAAQSYRAALRVQPDNAEATMGYALSRLLLLPDSEAVRALARATGGEEVTLEAALYGPQGALARLASGTPAEEVLRRLAAASPWGEQRLASVAAFLRGLPEGISLADLGWALAGLATELHDIASWLDGAASRPSLCFTIPGSAFHLEQDLALGPAEARLLAGLLRLGQGLTLAAAGLVGDEAPLALAGLAGTDELASTLNERFSRSYPLAGRLADARFALDVGLNEVVLALEQGSRQAAGTAGCPAAREGLEVPLVHWALASPAEITSLSRLLQAVRLALYAPAVLPDSEPATRLALERCFEAPYWPAAGLDQPFEAGDQEEELILQSSFLEAFLQPLAFPPVRPPRQEAGAEAEAGAGEGEGEEAVASAAAKTEAAAVAEWSWPRLFASGVPAPGFLQRWLGPLLDRLEQDLGIGG
ncbi:MAG: hypothetical protein FJ125_14940 [Deltaproteobacteria bacterium]|nr:hypothetical protein [Deltaproteobacteria bacterium]